MNGPSGRWSAGDPSWNSTPGTGHASRSLPSPGSWVQFVALAHGGVGLVLHRKPLVEMLRSKVVGTVPEQGDRATAFWFLTLTPVLWSSGRLLRSAELSGDLPAQRSTGRVFLAAGAAGAALMPRSPFWAVIATGAAILRRAARNGATPAAAPVLDRRPG